MKWFPRLQARGYWGKVSPPPFSYDLTSTQYFTAAKKSGGLKNLERLRGFEELQEEAELDASAALVLASRDIVPEAWNLKSAWSDAAAGSAMTYVEELPNLFGGFRGGLSYENDGVGASLRSSFEIAANQPFFVRAFLFEPRDLTDAEKEAYDLAGLNPRNVWETSFDRWLFRIVDGRFEIARMSENWTQELQDDLDALLDLQEPTDEEQEQIDNLLGPRRAEAGGVSYPDAIYDVYQSLDLGKPVEKQAGKFYELYFHPEPRGRLNIRLAGGKPQSVEVPEIIASRDVGTVYDATPLTVSTSGQCFLWQTGRPAFRPSGSLRIGPFKTGYWTDSMGAAILSAIADASLPGTSVTIEHLVHNSVWFSFLITVTTSDSQYSPFVYGGQANLVGGTRDGSTAVAWDSSTEGNRVLGGFPAILDVVPQCEGGSSGASGGVNRQQWQVTIKDPGGRALVALAGESSNDNNCEALENRICDLSGGSALDSQSKILTTGLVTSAQINDAARVRYDPGSGVLQLVRRWLFLEKTQLTLTLADGWAILDEDLMTESPIGDGQHLGAFLRLLLLNGGWSTAEIAGISATAGRVLPRAALGENPCVRPQRGTSRGQYLRSLLEKYGLGWSLRIDQNGVWQFAPRAGSIKTISGEEARFLSNESRNDAFTWPGRFSVFGALDHIRDTSDFFNYFRVEGWIDPSTGQRISDEWIIHESITRGGGTQPDLKFIGRLKRYDTVRDDGLRTPGDLQYALRSLVLMYGRSCRFVQFETYFHIGLLPGDLITVDGLPCEVVRITGGSMRKDRMTLVCMELGGTL